MICISILKIKHCYNFGKLIDYSIFFFSMSMQHFQMILYFNADAKLHYRFKLNNQFKHFLDNNLHSFESAFRNVYSCTAAFIRVLQDTRINTQNNKFEMLYNSI